MLIAYPTTGPGGDGTAGAGQLVAPVLAGALLPAGRTGTVSGNEPAAYPAEVR